MLTRLTLVSVIALATTALATSAASARALDLYDFSATGIETGVPSNNVSPFSGTAIGTGGLAIWSASVSRTALDPCGVTTILGGPFSLTGTSGVKLAGAFNSGGTVTSPAGFCSSGSAPCANETFSINATLTLNGNLTGTFIGSLNHFSTKIFGSCVTYFATISGQLRVNPTS
jgi:hypothetical protein